MDDTPRFARRETRSAEQQPFQLSDRNPMNWYYAEAGQQRGPVSDAELSGLVQAGTVRDDTLVWREGMADWQLQPGQSGAGGRVRSTAEGGRLCLLAVRQDLFPG